MVRTSDDKKAFYLYNDYIDHVKLMSDEDAGKLFKAILEYENDLEVQELSGVASYGIFLYQKSTGQGFQ